MEDRKPAVLGIVGSPRRRGNTHILVSKILDGAREEGAATETVLLGDLEISECDGCHACWKGKDCSKKDDMLPLYAKIVEADVIVFGTPVYWYGPTALMKGFLDRFVFFNCPGNRSRIRGKRAVLATPFEEEDLRAADLLVALFEKSLEYLEMRLVGKILVPGVGRRGEIRTREEHLKEAFDLGGRLVREAG